MQHSFVLAATEATRNSLPLFDLNAQTFLQMGPYLLSFVVLAYIFTKLLYKPVKRILQTRADRIETDLNEAAENKASAQELKILYEQKLGDIEVERAVILEAARKDASERVDQILSLAKTEAQITRDRAKRDIAAEQERVKAEVHQAIIDIATDMAEKLVAATIDKNNHDALFVEAMEALESTAFRAY